MANYTPKLLKRTEFGNPILRSVAGQLSATDISSTSIQRLIADMRFTLEKKEYGVGLAAPQVGRSIALSVIGIKSTPARPNNLPFEAVIINPSYEGIGRRTQLWEGCISFAGARSPVFAKAVRFKTIKAAWQDETGQSHKKELTGFIAHVFQHETDHLNGILFVDRVKDPTTWMNKSEYQKRVRAKSSR